MKEYLTKEQTDQIFNINTSNGCREMEEERFHQAANEAIHQAIQVNAVVSDGFCDNRLKLNTTELDVIINVFDFKGSNKTIDDLRVMNTLLKYKLSW